MNILVIGCCYSNNLGDAVICDCTAALLRRQYPQACVTVRDILGRTAFRRETEDLLGNARAGRRRYRLRGLAAKFGWDREYRSRHLVRARYLPRLEDLLREDCRMAVFAGGQLFMDGYGLILNTLTQGFAARGVPVFFNACGVGPCRSPAIRRELTQALTAENVAFLSCRDDVQTLSRRCGREAVAVSDPALWAEDVYGISADPEAAAVGLGIQFANTLPPGQIFRKYRQLIFLLEQRGIPWKLFTNGSETDFALAEALLRSLPQELQRPGALLPPAESPRALVAQIATLKCHISMRLHSHIIAASLGIPSIALIWDSKLPGFFEKMGCPERCLPIRTPANAVLAALDRANAQGVDREILARQRVRSAALLTDAINTTLRPAAD